MLRRPQDHLGFHPIYSWREGQGAASSLSLPPHPLNLHCLLPTSLSLSLSLSLNLPLGFSNTGRVFISSQCSRKPPSSLYHDVLYSMIAGCAAEVIPKEAGTEAGAAAPPMEEDLGGASPRPSHWWWLLCLLSDVMLSFFLCSSEYLKFFSHVGISLPHGSERRSSLCSFGRPSHFLMGIWTKNWFPVLSSPLVLPYVTPFNFSSGCRSSMVPF